MTWPKLITTIAAAAAMAFLLGLNIGLANPREAKTPRDLPAWACNEIVDARVDNARLVDGQPRDRWGLIYHRPVLDVCGDEGDR